MESGGLLFPILLMVGGFLLLGGELLIPFNGPFFLLGGLAVISAVVWGFMVDTTAGWAMLLIGFIGFPLAVGLLFAYLPYSFVGRLFMLPPPREDETMSQLAGHDELKHFVGRVGRTISDLRPAGLTDFDGRRVDTISEGMMISAGSWVRCIRVEGGRVIVRPVEKPTLSGLENADFL